MSPVWRRNPMSTLQIYKKFLVINSFTHHSYFILPPQLPSSIHSLILSPPFTPSSLHSFNPSPINSFNLTAVIPLSQQPGSSLSPFPRFSKRPSCAQRPPLHTKPPPTPPPCAQGPPLHTRPPPTPPPCAQGPLLHTRRPPTPPPCAQRPPLHTKPPPTPPPCAQSTPLHTKQTIDGQRMNGLWIMKTKCWKKACPDNEQSPSREIACCETDTLTIISVSSKTRDHATQQTAAGERFYSMLRQRTSSAASCARSSSSEPKRRSSRILRTKRILMSSP